MCSFVWAYFILAVIISAHECKIRVFGAFISNSVCNYVRESFASGGGGLFSKAALVYAAFVLPHLVIMQCLFGAAVGAASAHAAALAGVAASTMPSAKK